jgi:NAD(P)-dependent dehydrogenase (short-subunit alcohol dehydrogenase family)/acyl carrier protein
MLGRSVAKWLISKGAKHLILTGRNASTDTAKELFSAEDVDGASIEVVACDISRQNDVRRLMRTISKNFTPLKGVVHSVGVLDDGILAQLDWDRFARVFEPKVYGSWLLHENTKSLELDFFILQSSVLSLLGSAGQANYSASNTFVDSLAAHRRAAGLPAMAINWSAWSGGGLATASGARGEAMWSSLGVKFVSPDLAMKCFDSLMHRDVDQIAVAIADWSTYAGKVGNPPFLAELLNGREVLEPSKSARANGAAAVVQVNGGTRGELLSRLQQRIMAELGFVDPIDLDRPLNEVGLDSLRSVTLANNLEDEFGILISISQLISGPTINQLVDHLSGLLAMTAKDQMSGSTWKLHVRNESPRACGCAGINGHSLDERQSILLSCAAGLIGCRTERRSFGWMDQRHPDP